MNSRLKHLMELGPASNRDIQEDFFNELKKATLLLAIDSESKPLKLEHSEGIFTPLFTDDSEIREFGTISFIRYTTEDLIDLLSLEDDLVNVVINPANDHSFGMKLDFFISNCRENKFQQLFELTKLVKKGVKPLDEISIFYLREEVPFMLENMNDDNVFTSPIPIAISSNEEFNSHLPYLNTIYVPKGILFAENNSDDFGDVVLAPIIKLKLIEKADENNFIWQCVEQDFNVY